ncbi:MAG: insulinase family protein [Muribaculaceae bacterium]|nr:insulinase family protein [Muribaculaceae bacterium]MDE6753139.1 insulinase family protein [Muribaculaceae bacterium]
MSQLYSVFTLSNGLRVVFWQTDSLVSYIGTLVNAGSRDESETKYGLAHFVEHTLFKGTLHRKSWQVSCRMEEVGGELNAYTSKETTMVYTNAPAGYEERAVELLVDIISSSQFPKNEIDKEREVVIEEIKSYLDSPSDSVFDKFEELIYKGSGLSHNILGTPESVKKLTGEDCRNFVERFYTPGNMVMYCSSPMKAEKFLALVEKYFGKLHFPSNPPVRLAPPAIQAFNEREEAGNNQANTIVGTRLFGRDDSRRFALFLFNNYFGGPGMNSVLNRELREKRGYVYTVDSLVGLMSDTSLWMVYFGSDPSKVDKCRSIVINELDRIAQSGPSPTKFEKIKRQYCGQMLVQSDNRESRSMALAKNMMFYNEVYDSAAVAGRIREVASEEFREIAQLILSAGCSTLTLC